MINESVVYSLSFTMGIVFFCILVIMEFLKQIKSDEILYFKENKMFYIIVGVILGYLGTFPFLTFNKILYTNHIQIWNVLYVFYMFLNSLMYLLFAASFIWGKRQS